MIEYIADIELVEKKGDKHLFLLLKDSSLGEN